MKSKKEKLKKNHEKEVKKNRKKMATTLEWMDVDSIDGNRVILKKNKKTMILQGIKLTPYDIYLDPPEMQRYRVQLMRSALNNIKSKLYHGFVFNPVNLDAHLARLFKQLNLEEDEVIQSMIEDDIEKALAFVGEYRELEFFIIIKGVEGDRFEKAYHQLVYELKRAQFTIKPLNRLDWENYIAFAFDNQVINDYYFSRGIFDYNFEEEGVI
ncbi:MAG: hypothetical protein RR788_04140 [Erysipelotrichaceae bacterium]